MKLLWLLVALLSTACIAHDYEGKGLYSIGSYNGAEYVLDTNKVYNDGRTFYAYILTYSDKFKMDRADYGMLALGIKIDCAADKFAFTDAIIVSNIGTELEHIKMLGNPQLHRIPWDGPILSAERFLCSRMV